MKDKTWGHGEKGTGAGYFLGFLGAFLYYIHTATSFWMGLLGFLKALVWPGFLVYSIFQYLKL